MRFGSENLVEMHLDTILLHPYEKKRSYKNTTKWLDLIYTTVIFF